MNRFLRVGTIVLVLAVPTTGFGQSSRIDSIDGSPTLFGVRGVSVPAVNRSETAMLVDIGTIDTDGFEKIVLNIAGRVAGEVGFKSGAVGAVLVPDVSPFDVAYQTYGLLPDSIEISAVADRPQGTFMAKQVTFDVGFPRYRVLLYNNSSQPATVNFFAYRRRT